MGRVTDRLAGLAFGGDYNPEQWPEEVWAEDVALMRAARVNLVTVNVFGWAELEPAEGSYDFSRLDRVLDLLHAGGIAVDLANASASPPPWFSHRYPAALPVDVDGVRRSYGGRQAFCPSSPDYRAAAARLTQAVGERYNGHPAVVMWHVHNEYGCHNWDCYCDVSAAAFRHWLARRYGSLAALNEAWGTAFWSQRYSAWDEVLPPRRTAYRTFANPTQQLDFWRFSSDELLDCFKAEAALLRSVSDLPVTTNFMGFFKPVDYWAWAAEQDLISDDHYRVVEASADRGTHELAMAADLMRSLAGGSPWLQMEQSTSAVNWQPRNPPKPPGQMRRDSFTQLARGADGALFFQWRASRAGAEKFHSGLVPHAGTDSDHWRDVVALGTDIAAVAAVAGSTVHADVAIALDWHSWWAIELDSHPSVDVDGLSELRAYHRALWERGITCDFVQPGADLTGYRLVVVPTLYLIDDEAAASFAAFVRSGGTLLVTYFSGIVDPDDHIRLGGYPGAFTELLGVRVEEFAPLLAGETIGVDWGGTGAAPEPGTGTVWSEVATARGAEVLAAYAGGPLAGRPVVTRHRVGDGTAWYVGTRLGEHGHDRLVDQVTAGAGVGPVLGDTDRPGPDVDVVERVGPQGRFVFVMNHGTTGVAVPVTGTNLLTGADWTPADQVGPGAVAVIRRTGPR